MTCARRKSAACRDRSFVVTRCLPTLGCRRGAHRERPARALVSEIGVDSLACDAASQRRRARACGGRGAVRRRHARHRSIRRRAASSDGGAGGWEPAARPGGTGGTAASARGHVDCRRAGCGTRRPDPGTCRNLQCQQRVHGGTRRRRVTGTVYAPNGTLPIYNAPVYVPNAPLPALPSGPVRDRCGTLPPGEPVVGAATDAHGALGWRTYRRQRHPARDPGRQMAARNRDPEVAPCAVTALTDPEQTRPPRTGRRAACRASPSRSGACDNLSA